MDLRVSHKDIGEQINKMYMTYNGPEKTQSLGPLYVMAVAKATLDSLYSSQYRNSMACSPMHIRFEILYNAMYKHALVKIRFTVPLFCHEQKATYCIVIIFLGFYFMYSLINECLYLST